MGAPGYFLILPCNVTSEFGLSIVFLIRLPSHPFLRLKGLQCSRPSSQSLNFQLSACTSHMRFGKSSSIVTECFSLMLVFLTSFFTNAISHRGSAKAAHPCHFSTKNGVAHVYDVYTGPRGDVYYLNFVQANAHKWCKCHKR